MPYLSPSPGTRHALVGRARLLLLGHGALPVPSGVTLAGPHGWVSVIAPPRELTDLAAAHPDGIDVDVRAAVVRSDPRGHRAVRLVGPVQVAGQPTAHTTAMAEGLLTAAEVSVRAADLEDPQLRAICVGSVSTWAAEAEVLLPDAAASSGHPYDYPGGWATRTQALLADLEHFQRLEPLSPEAYALARAAAVLADQPIEAVPDGAPRSATSEGHAAVIGRAMQAVDARAPSPGSSFPLVRVLAALVCEDSSDDSPEGEVASRLRSRMRSLARAWESVRDRITVVGPEGQSG